MKQTGLYGKKVFWLNLLVVCALFNSSILLAQEDIVLSYGDEEFISIATGRKQLISRAPSVASVVTAEQIKKMGAKDIAEALEAVPGVHVARKAGGYNPVFIFRGIYTEFNPQVLVLIDGVPLTSLLYGDRGQAWGGLPVESISRIEIIRGPGSAIYGADAFAGTINIITKNPGEIVQDEMGYSYGSYDEHSAWIMLDGEIAGWKTIFSAQGVDSNGSDEIIESDLQTFFDQQLNTDASRAPGELSLSKETYDLYLKAHKENWKVNINYALRNDLGIGVGAAGALDHIGRAEGDRLTAQIGHISNSIFPNTQATTSLSYQRMHSEFEFVLLPPGFEIGAFSFPNGVLGQPKYNEEHVRLDFSFFYSGIEGHGLTFGTGYHYHDQYQLNEKKNAEFILTPSGLVPVPLSGLVDVSDTMPFNQEEIRKVAYIYLQDEWQIAPDWSLTAGLRYDNYSDFGDTINPRLALVWEASYSITAKMLYGRAFRAPSFAELFSINNPVTIGNPDLDPETIDTYEFALTYVVNDRLSTGLNIFYYEMQDIIRFDPYVAENTGDQTGHGVEFEMEWDPLSYLHITANYAWQSSEDEQTDHAAPNAPQHQVYLRGDWEFVPGWFANLQVNRVMDRKRAAMDDRDPVDDYTQVDLILRATRLFPTWEFAAGIKNITDEDIYEPSLAGAPGAPIAIPGDLPMPGRNYFAEIRKTF